ncbi:MAG: RNA-binding domain-containing protein [Candidatus Bathyarchaeota archaeon]
MGKNPRQSVRIEVSLFIHATEDPEKVLKAVKNIFQLGHDEDIEFERSNLMGYHKNTITMLKIIIREKVRVAAFLKNLFKKLEAQDKTNLCLEFKEYIDSEGTLYMRLDKQEALNGKIRFCSVDPIHVKIKFNFLPKTLEDLESFLI